MKFGFISDSTMAAAIADSPGLFELCNPHLLSHNERTERLMNAFAFQGSHRSQLQILELFTNLLSPKEQRVHRDNRRGIKLKRLQRASDSKTNGAQKHNVITKDQDGDVKSSKNGEVKRAARESEGPQSKRAKITWP